MYLSVVATQVFLLFACRNVCTRDKAINLNVPFKPLLEMETACPLSYIMLNVVPSLKVCDKIPLSQCLERKAQNVTLTL